MADKFFTSDASTRKTLTEIAALFGVPNELVKSVWEYTIISMFLKLTESPGKLQNVTIPYIGTLGLRYKGDAKLSSGKLEPDIDAFISLSKGFKRTISDVCQGEYGELCTYVEQHRMRDLVKMVGFSDSPSRNRPRRLTSLAK